MENLQQLKGKTTLSLEEAALLISANGDSLHEVETMLAEAIERSELPANVKRWATEQWHGKQLPGNINRLETYIERGDLDAWLHRKGRSI